MRRMSKEEFIIKSRNIHGDKYNYDNSDFTNVRNIITIICNVCGYEFSITPDSHLYQKSGCPVCANNQKYDNDTFIKKSKEKHGDKYDYSLVNYKGNKNEVKIICHKHGVFKLRAGSHLNGTGCSNDKKRMEQEDFIRRSILIHGDKYDYSLVNYIGYDVDVLIKCKKHEVFKQPTTFTFKRFWLSIM
jgi:hypothetical protein